MGERLPAKSAPRWAGRVSRNGRALVRALQPELAIGADTVDRFIALIAALEREASVVQLLSCLVPN